MFITHCNQLLSVHPLAKNVTFSSSLSGLAGWLSINMIIAHIHFDWDWTLSRGLAGRHNVHSARQASFCWFDWFSFVMVFISQSPERYLD